MSFAPAKTERAVSRTPKAKELVTRRSYVELISKNPRRGRGGVKAPSLRGENDGSESWLHRYTHNLLKLSANRGVMFMHMGNGLKRSPKVMAMLKNMGVRTGAFDWLIIVEGKAHWLELKAPKKEPSEEQLKFMDEARAAGCSAFVADDPIEVRSILWGWGAINVLPDTVREIA